MDWHVQYRKDGADHVARHRHWSLARWRPVDWLGGATVALIVLVLLAWALFGAEVFGLIGF